MSHRIARLLEPLLRFRRRRPPTTPPAPVLGVGVGSIGMPSAIVKVTK
ncbi:hypothetical protein AB0I77_00165 [Streptomyces sp. NPDC050619]